MQVSVHFYCGCQIRFLERRWDVVGPWGAHRVLFVREQGSAHGAMVYPESAKRTAHSGQRTDQRGEQKTGVRGKSRRTIFKLYHDRPSLTCSLIFISFGDAVREKILVFLLCYSHSTDTRCVGVSRSPTNSQTPAGGPTIQLDSDTNWSHSRHCRLRAQPHKTASYFRHQSQVHWLPTTSIRLGYKWEVPMTPPRVWSFASAAHRTQENSLHTTADLLQRVF